MRAVVEHGIIDDIGANLHDIHRRGILPAAHIHDIGRRHRRRLLPARHAQDHLADLRLLEAVRPDGARLDGLQHSGAARVRLEAAQLRGRALRGIASGDSGAAQDGDDTRDGLGKDAGARVGVEHGEDALGVRGGVEDEGAVQRVEGRTEDGAQGEEVRVRREGEVGEGGGVDLLAEGVDGGVWEGGDMVGVDDEEGVGGFNDGWRGVSVMFW